MKVFLRSYFFLLFLLSPTNFRHILATCCSVHGDTGWWFDSYLCGMANLNGIRCSCEYLQANPNTKESIIWNFEQRPKSAQMLLRPKNYPSYDRPHGKKFINLIDSSS